MSSKDKIEFLQLAQQQGFRTYLYFVATADPEINISRVAYRVKMGGHPVPPDKIIQRYYRSLNYLIDAVTYANRAYLFDNSTDSDSVLLAEITDGVELELKVDTVPQWFKTAILDKF
jgi:predicted ABC-type ATPase